MLNQLTEINNRKKSAPITSVNMVKIAVYQVFHNPHSSGRRQVSAIVPPMNSCSMEKRVQWFVKVKTAGNRTHYAPCEARPATPCRHDKKYEFRFSR